MHVVGILWTFYPLLGLMALIEFSTGLAHVFFCLPFSVFLLPMLSGIAASITSVYALLLHNPNSCELLLQFISALLGFGLLLVTATEAVCLRRVRAEHGDLSVCAGILNRTLSSQSKCSDIFGGLQYHLLQKTSHVHNISPIEDARDAGKIVISTILAVASLVQVFAGVVLTLYSAAENRFQLSAPHWQAIFGIFTLLLSYVYHSYCCVFFHSYFVTCVAVFCLIQAAVPWHFPVRSSSRQLFSIFGAGLCSALLALTSFGFYCWAHRYSAPWKYDRSLSNLVNSQSFWNSTMVRDKSATSGIYRYCIVPKQAYMLCERTLEFSTPYVWWTQDQVQSEVEIIQIVVLVLLTLNGCLHFLLFIYDAFGS